ncbi:hypothetical protein NLJ89_g5273 [Agrocybe chaxingu]|uniref:Uncharacterized protein n=1 Tax=Agrocybe chaxingu TaxID=84603 RepID=A0A9W8K1C3_9AGAR|nr:hypothetical protein NLJ89_g5273 [Agrocybe chaxingu]
MDLTDITVAEFLAILAKSPNINTLCARSIKRAPHEQTFSPPSHPITHPAIKTVRLYENNYSEKFDMLFDHITLPSLQEFLIKQSISPRLTAMLSRSLPPLTGLTIIASSITRETMRVFMATPHVMELDLRCQNIPASFFKRLGSTSSFSPLDRVQLLPVLSSLKMRCEHKFPWACVADMFGQRPVLQGLGPESIYRPLRTFALVITKGTIWAGTDYENDIEPVDNETLQRLRALEMAGISISISDRHGEDLLSETVCGDGTSAED